jgi:hypothetical protein
MKPLVTLAVYAYAVSSVVLWLAVDTLADRAWWATLIAFGPRWPAVLPILPLVLFIAAVTSGRVASRLIVLVALSAFVLVFGFMDYRVGFERAAGSPVLRILTQNLGEGRVTGRTFDRLLKAERIDVAALQECPFYDNDMARLGWHFYYGGDLCLVSRYPFEVLGLRDPDNAWRRSAHDPIRFGIDTPLGRLELLNVHLETIRGGLEAVGARPWRALPQFTYNRADSALESRAARAKIGNSPSTPFVVAGDFNLPVESAIYRENWGDLGNAFSLCGRGFGHTKFTGLFGIRIDHVLMSAQLHCADARVLVSPYAGDHVPLVVDLVRR